MEELFIIARTGGAINNFLIMFLNETMRIFICYEISIVNILNFCIGMITKTDTNLPTCPLISVAETGSLPTGFMFRMFTISHGLYAVVLIPGLCNNTVPGCCERFQHEHLVNLLS